MLVVRMQPVVMQIENNVQRQEATEMEVNNNPTKAPRLVFRLALQLRLPV